MSKTAILACFSASLDDEDLDSDFEEDDEESEFDAELPTLVLEEELLSSDNLFRRDAIVENVRLFENWRRIEEEEEDEPDSEDDVVDEEVEVLEKFRDAKDRRAEFWANDRFGVDEDLVSAEAEDSVADDGDDDILLVREDVGFVDAPSIAEIAFDWAALRRRVVCSDENRPEVEESKIET